MAYELQKLNYHGKPLTIDAEMLRRRIDDLLEAQAQRYQRLWMYYRNPMLPRTLDRDEQGSDRPYRQAQEWGLPSRVTGARAGTSGFSSEPLEDVARKEVVIENDIGWRIDSMIDFLIGSPVQVTSTVSDPARRTQIEKMLRSVIAQNGGMLMLQQLALLGSVYGLVDVVVKFDAAKLNEKTDVNEPASDAAPASTGNGVAGGVDSLPPPAGPASRAGHNVSAPHLDEQAGTGASHLPSPDAHVVRIARTIRLEVIEPARALPVLSDVDWRQVQTYVQVYQVPARQSVRRRAEARRGFVHRLGATAGRLFRSASSRGGAPFGFDERTTIVEVLTSDAWQRYEDEVLIDEGINSLGEIPLVHIQNLAVPFQYSGTSDVEPLIPLQDELNTRLSDRANRITMQCFKMYLGKGIENFTSLPVAPGRMWATDNADANVIEFGGDASSPSEDEHIAELREAMDKISGVTPIAAGAIRGKIGNLTSAAALRVTMIALLAKTQRKRTTFGQAIARMCELALGWLDCAGLFPTTPEERHVEIVWPKKLMIDE